MTRTEILGFITDTTIATDMEKPRTLEQIKAEIIKEFEAKGCYRVYIDEGQDILGTGKIEVSFISPSPKSLQYHAALQQMEYAKTYN